jgi:hypothetical protein
VLLGGGLGVSLLWAFFFGLQVCSAYAGYLKYVPQEGDVIFQALPQGPIV